MTKSTDEYMEAQEAQKGEAIMTEIIETILTKAVETAYSEQSEEILSKQGQRLKMTTKPIRRRNWKT